MKLIALLVPFCLVAAVCADESVNGFLRATLENFKGTMKTENHDLGLPILDPLIGPMVNEHIEEGPAKIDVVVEKLTIHGMSSFVVENVDIDLLNLRLSLSLVVPHVEGKARYDLKGKIMNIIPIYGNGPASVQFTDLRASVTAALSITDEGYLQANEFSFDPSFSAIAVNFENIMGGGSLGQVVNGVVNTIGKTIFDKFKPMITAQGSKAIQGLINNALKGVKLSDILGGLMPMEYSNNVISYQAGNANSYLDQMLALVLPMVEEKLDPVNLPEKSLSFSKSVMGKTVYGDAKVSQGWIKGLSNLQRFGDAEMIENEDGAIIDATVGLKDVQGHYRVSAKFMGHGPETDITVDIPSLAVHVKVEQRFVLGSAPKLLEFEVTGLDNINVKFDSGFGALDWAMGKVATMVTEHVKSFMLKTINQLKGLVEEKLQEIKIALPIIGK